WLVPVVYEAEPLALRAAAAVPQQAFGLNQAEAARERARLDLALPVEPGAGFYGRDETLLAVDPPFDTAPLLLLHAWAGAGKPSTGLEFARWYALTGAADHVLFTSFTHHVPLARLIDQVGERFKSELTAAGAQWAARDEGQRREWALRVLEQAQVMW